MYNYYLRKAVNLYLKVSKEDDETMASGRQFQSAIVFGKNEKLKTSLLICIWHAKFTLMASPRATLGVLN